MIMKLAEYTTSTYESSLTSSSVYTVSYLSTGTESSYSDSYTSNTSGTFYSSELLNSRSVTWSYTTSSTSRTSNMDVSGSLIFEAVTGSSTYSQSVELRGKTTWQDTWSTRSTRSMVSLEFSHTGITSIVTVSSYGNYTSSFTTYSNKVRTDTTITSTMAVTTARRTSAGWVIVESAEWWTTSRTYTHYTTECEYLVSSGVKSSIIYSESGGTYRAGNSYYTDSTTSSSRLVATMLSATLYNSSSTNAYSSTSSNVTYAPATSIKYSGVSMSTLTDYSYDNSQTYTYVVTYSYETTVYDSTASYYTVTTYPIIHTSSVDTSSSSTIDEYISYISESTAGPLYLGSQSLSIVSQASTTTTETNSHSSSWLDRVRELTASDGTPNTISGITYVQSRSFDYFYTYTEITYDPLASINRTTTLTGRAEYETYARDITTWVHELHYTSSVTTFSSTTGQSTCWYSSTTYTGLFDNTLRLSTTLSNYVSETSSAYSSKSQQSLVAVSDFDARYGYYSEYAGSSSSSYR